MAGSAASSHRSSGGRHPHSVRGPCAWNHLFLSCIHLPERRQMHLVPAQVWDRPLHRAQAPRSKTCDSPLRIDRQLFSAADPLHRTTPYAGNETPRPQGQDASRACLVRRGARGRKRQHDAQAGADVRHSQTALDARNRYHRRRRGRGALRRLRLPALAGSELPAGTGRYLRFALADPTLRTAHRRHHRWSHPLAQGRRALFRAAQGQHHQFRGP